LKSDEFIREVDEDLLRDRWMTLWRRYGRLLIAAAVLLVVGVAADQAWRAWRQSQINAEAARYNEAQAALGNEQWKDAAAALQGFATTADPGYATLARLQQATALERSGDRPGAITALDSIAADTKADALLRDLSSLYAAQLQLDTATPADLRARLVPLAEAGRPWRNSAREMLALVAVRAGENAQANEILTALAEDAEVTPAQKQRATVLRESLGATGS
jgi:hypothetical protein